MRVHGQLSSKVKSPLSLFITSWFLRNHTVERQQQQLAPSVQGLRMQQTKHRLQAQPSYHYVFACLRLRMLLLLLLPSEKIMAHVASPALLISFF
jgi:hypothetical protein